MKKRNLVVLFFLILSGYTKAQFRVALGPGVSIATESDVSDKTNISGFVDFKYLIKNRFDVGLNVIANEVSFATFGGRDLSDFLVPIYIFSEYNVQSRSEFYPFFGLGIGGYLSEFGGFGDAAISPRAGLKYKRLLFRMTYNASITSDLGNFFTLHLGVELGGKKKSL